MAAAVMVMVMVALTVCINVDVAAGQGLCKMTQEGLTACKPSISTVKAEANPSEACCSALKQANLTCLCSFRNSNLLPYLGINPDLAMQLPAKCSIAPPQTCN
ncbi:putative lipid-transfer protein DIR1 [Zingiber officinale]|uniref:Bifunctional inhibitor/plant lipid transfer protein/seed storage helical domain-containing protein n=1 Tax=Zingiber officinale TaxID=94328 RepID=A0A8J5LZR2_ZINOF|nr:putative lipid-transfer protein DIR1 [Zingiber officinale]KAG6529292.1 hypothetical protein ZIOFF_011489 [Zingiber officinale]